MPRCFVNCAFFSFTVKDQKSGTSSRPATGKSWALFLKMTVNSGENYLPNYHWWEVSFFKYFIYFIFSLGCPLMILYCSSPTVPCVMWSIPHFSLCVISGMCSRKLATGTLECQPGDVSRTRRHSWEILRYFTKICLPSSFLKKFHLFICLFIYWKCKLWDLDCFSSDRP